MSRVIFIGPPGSGKSSVGKALARELGLTYEDTDASVSSISGRSIAAIFAELGESGFRKLEREVVLAALSSNIQVLSLGGGAVLDPDVQAAIKASECTVIYLTIGLRYALSRIGNKGDRPLVASDPEKQWLKITNSREPIYRALATIVKATDNKKPQEVAHEIAQLIRGAHG